MANGVFNETALRALILERAAAVRSAAEFSRVAMGPSALYLRRLLTEWIDDALHRHPTSGKTITINGLGAATAPAHRGR